MKFFIPVPGAATRRRSSGRRSASELDKSGLATTRRRIHALACAIGDEDHLLAVGEDTPEADDPVLAIFEASDIDLYYVCTFGTVALEEPPYPWHSTRTGG